MLVGSKMNFIGSNTYRPTAGAAIAALTTMSSQQSVVNAAPTLRYKKSELMLMGRATASV